MDIINSLKNPSAAFKPLPFWSFNDKLEETVLREQIREMHKAGLGGYFMHARGGLKTKYLGMEWMDCIKACVDEGKKLGMNSWCYDENGWPSGFADGIVPSMGEAFHVKWLVLEEIEEHNSEQINNYFRDSSVLGLYSLNKNKPSCTRLKPGEKVNSSDTCIVIRINSNPHYIDILNKDTVKAFIDITHEEYFKQLGEEFGSGIPGFFTDEPQFSRGQIPWSHIMPDKFLERFGYDVLEHLPSLYIQCEGYEKFRYHYWSLVSELYVTAFGKQIYDWCEEHNCKLTGHVMSEDSLLTQMESTAGAMPFYEYMHIPGMDWLGRAIDSPVIPKQVSSVAAQLGKKQVLSETFALCGWNVSFEELKWIAEWQYVNGVNLMCQHLEGYTLRGFRKRDYPPSLFIQQSWWNEYSHFNNYFARLGMLLSDGEPGVKVLLIHPIKSAWIAYNHSDNPGLSELDNNFRYVTEMLSKLHIGHDYGDETLMGKYGSVKGASLQVGKCNYKAVILPSMLTLDKSTLELLKELMNNGGLVLSMGNLPEMCQGQPNDALIDFKRKILSIKDNYEIYNTFKTNNILSISISDESGEIPEIAYCEKVYDSSTIYYLVNHSKRKISADIKIFKSGNVRKVLLENAEYMDINQEAKEDGVSFKLDFEPMQSHVMFLDKIQQAEEKSTDSLENSSTGSEKETGEKENSSQIQGVPYTELQLRPKWRIENMGLNSLTLDYCWYSIDYGPWEGPIHTINLMELLLSRRRDCKISLKFYFNVEAQIISINELYLAIEDAMDFTVTVNGNKITYTDIGFWKDYSFNKVNIRDFVKQGNNEVILTRDFYQAPKVYNILFGENVLETEINKLTYDVELESIYLIGDFGVSSRTGFTYTDRDAMLTAGPFAVTDKPAELTAGSFTEQGLCFFSETLTVTQNICIGKETARYILDLGKPMAPMCKVFINDVCVNSVLWAPYRLDVTDYLQQGDNKISITLYASNRNLLGPHHNLIGESYSVGPSTFTARAGWSEQNSMSSENMWTDTYCFVKFGI